MVDWLIIGGKWVEVERLSRNGGQHARERGCAINVESSAPSVAWQARHHPKTKTLKLIETSHLERILAKQNRTVQPSEITARALFQVII
ncbi:hypothetical protein EDS67_03505 [candidate division KSB1 bacterium]|nr:MAG: hypothetical protein EDS67_03505 [candidate division KSB1 bacterium]MBC6951002.1 hypothetical protein [candidate division KSB1 bacterium]MCE7939993.1 hypothetical protein [Chlorobi bacterium CHB1]